MTETLLFHEIDRLLDAIDGELMSRSRVEDGLLDLRLAAGAMPTFVGAVDHALGDIPGRSTVTNDWWMTTLADLREVAATSSVTAS